MSRENLGPQEDDPLLSAGERADSPIGSKPRYIAGRWQAKSPTTIVLLVALIKFAVTASGMLLLVPIYRLIEDAICHVYYGDESSDPIDEMQCKVDAVQSRLAYLLGWVNLLNSVITFLLAYPFGMLADRIGRKPMALMSYFGLSLSFAFGPLMLSAYNESFRRNPYLIMTGSLFLVLGGGVQVLLATLYAIAADVSDEKDQASSFLYLTFGATAGGLIGPVLAGILMKRYGPWVPIIVVLAITPFLFCLFFFIPETLAKHGKSSDDDAEEGGRAPTVRQQVAEGLRDLAASLTMLKNPSILLVLVTFLVQNARFAAYVSLLAQYMSKHFLWRLADTSLLLSPLGLLNLALLAVLPTVSKMLMSRMGYTTFGKDLLLTQVSTVLIVIGAFIEAFSHNVVLFVFGLVIGTLGAADSPLARATVSHYVEPQYISRLYGLISMVEILGSFIGSPVLAWLFDKGLQHKGIWIGLPYFYIGVLCCISLVALMFVRPPRKDAARSHVHSM
ncbi:major facilitator superfamily domain-containing protein [Stachybotrys elegans]|uniref:Major facilitator superfamily domain-containing protein n=1 Tax=Stachybotrys elegans TaxID=80388 RepID=A0A8K0WSD3_9HYPO|nr:major facilitator superfamily domain-containing protein [Stachybotrys elegans]